LNPAAGVGPTEVPAFSKQVSTDGPPSDGSDSSAEPPSNYAKGHPPTKIGDDITRAPAWAGLLAASRDAASFGGDEGSVLALYLEELEGLATSPYTSPGGDA
jgi:hypothetical protein